MTLVWFGIGLNLKVLIALNLILKSFFVREVKYK